MIKNHFRILWRKLLKDRQFTFLNLTGLSTGLAVTMLIYLWVNDEINVDKFHERDSGLYKAMYNIQTSNGILTQDYTPYPLAEALTTEIPEVEMAVSVNPFTDFLAGPGIVSYENNHIKAQGVFASKDYFNVFSYNLIYGDKNSVLTDKNGVAISESLAKKLFSSVENSLGKSLDWGHKVQLGGPFHISGVFETPPSNSTQQFDIVFNYDLLLKADPNARDWKGTYAETYIVLKKGTDTKLFENKIHDLPTTKDPANAKCSIFIQQFSKKYLYGKYENGVQAGGRIQYVKLFSIIALFILAIACINFMNLSTAQATRKMKEVGVKKALGASRQSLIFQFLVESIFLAFLSLAIALLLITLLLPQFNNLTGKHIVLNNNAGSLLAAAGITLFTGIIAGCYPALYLSAFKPVNVLKGKLITSLSELLIRKGLVVVQFTISVIFIVGVLTINKQIGFIQTKNLGYSRDNIITFKREGKVKEDPEIFLSMLKSMPGVVNASCMPGSILDATDVQSGFSWRGQKSDETYLFKSPRIGYDVIETLGMELLAGRSFSRNFGDDDSRIILNESAAKMMNLKDPIGKTIKRGNSESRIIGIVKDFQYGSLHQRIEPLIFRFRNAFVGNNVLVKIKPGAETTTIKRIEALYKKVHPEYSFEFTFLDEDYQKLYASEQKIGSLSKNFAGLAIMISCLGLFGLAAFTAQRRQKEIGIRKIVGATAGNIMIMLSGDFLKLVFIAILVASPLAWLAMNKWLENFAYKINIGWEIFIIAAVLALMITLLTVSYQAIKAAVANPVKSLRTE